MSEIYINRLSRKNYLIPLANKFSINHKEFRNKILLYNEIKKKQKIVAKINKYLKLSMKNIIIPLAKKYNIQYIDIDKRVICENIVDYEYNLYLERKKCYNMIEPCTLEHISDIENEDYIQWFQHNHFFGCRKSTIVSLFSKNNTILPWSIDFCSSKEKYDDIDKFYKLYDMKNIPELKQLYIEKHESEIEIQETNFNNWFMFKIEELTNNDLYITQMINNIINYESYITIFESISQAMYNTLYALKDSNDSLFHDIFRDVCFRPYLIKSSIGYENKNEHLTYLIFIIQNFYNIVLDYVVIQNFFLELNNILIP